MANQDAAFGLKPLGKIGGSPDNNAATEYEVAACASAFSQNDLMKVIPYAIIQLSQDHYQGNQPELKSPLIEKYNNS